MKFKSELLQLANEVTFIKVILSFIILIVAPVKESLITAILLGFFDFILGIYASYKEGYKITSRSMRRTVSKIVVYGIAIIVCYHIQANLLDYPLLTGITGLIALIEGKSIFENLYRITKIDFLKIIINKFQVINDQMNPPSSSKDEQPTYMGKKKDEKEN